MRGHGIVGLLLLLVVFACAGEETGDDDGNGGEGAQGGQGAQGAQGGDGAAGGTGGCTVPEDCPEPSGPCEQRTCEAGACNVELVPAGTAAGQQTDGDCQEMQCSSAGTVEAANDDTDVPDDANVCTEDGCSDGSASHVPSAAGTPCGNGTVCNGSGQCVGCLEPGDCPGTDDECQARTCEAGVCGMAFTPASTKLAAQTPGDCQVAVCDGSGGTTTEPADTDLPDDANECTSNTCVGGVPTFDPLVSGTACTQGGGQVCDGGGSCVECVGNAQCGGGSCIGNVCAPLVIATTPAGGAVEVAPGASIAVTFSEAMDPASLTAQTAGGPCTGSIQLSFDGFASCVGFSTAAPAMSAGDTVATLFPQPGLAHGITLELKVTTAAMDATAVALGLEHNGSFSTVSPSSCAGKVVLSQIYGGGGNSGAPFTNDFVVLHNTGEVLAVLDGWSLQYASSAGSTFSVLPLSGAIAPGGFFLVALAGGANGVALPPADASGSINMAAASGKVALVSHLAGLSGTCPSSPEIVDFVGYGSANCFEGASAAPALSNTTAAHRDVSGCLDGDFNGDEFRSAAPLPQNSQAQAAHCSCAADGVLNESDTPPEADFCNVQFPASFSVDRLQATPMIFGQIYEAGVTEPPGAPAGIEAQVGYARDGALVSAGGWAWFDAAYNVQAGNNDEFMGDFTAPVGAQQSGASAVYRYAYRFTSDGGASYTYCDDDGAGSNPGLDLNPAAFGTMTVTTP